VSVQALPRAIARHPEIERALAASDHRVDVVATPALHLPLVAGAIEGDSAGVVLVITATSREASQTRDALRQLVRPDVHVWDLPAWETLPHERLSPHPDTVARRVSAIRALNAASQHTTPLVIVASVRAVIQPVNPQLAQMPWYQLAPGQTDRSLESWAEVLLELGYQRVDLVTRRGEFALRGGILDVFPPLAEHPIRADFFGSELEQLTSFQVSDQRSLEG